MSRAFAMLERRRLQQWKRSRVAAEQLSPQVEG
jgi:hypothetical protein